MKKTNATPEVEPVTMPCPACGENIEVTTAEDGHVEASHDCRGLGLRRVFLQPPQAKESE